MKSCIKYVVLLTVREEADSFRLAVGKFLSDRQRSDQHITHMRVDCSVVVPIPGPNHDHLKLFLGPRRALLTFAFEQALYQNPPPLFAAQLMRCRSLSRSKVVNIIPSLYENASPALPEYPETVTL